MAIDYSEKGFERNVEESLIDSGFVKRKLDGKALDEFREFAIDVDVFFQFLEESQPKELARLQKAHGENYRRKIMYRLNRELSIRGMIDCIRHGIRDTGVTLRLAYNRPSSNMNQTLIDLYGKNIFTIYRQVFYSSDNQNSVDMMICLNGLPIVVMELKNHLTGQTVDDAKRQFMEDRNPNEVLFSFKKRTIVYFAVDTDEVYMTTCLNRHKTFFLPFNQGNDGGKGNKPSEESTYKTAYLWDKTLQKDSLLDILFRFVYLKVDEIKDSTGEIVLKDERLIFPRYHQLDVVRKLEVDAKMNGAGRNYLIQHSAGSGKTNSISWLAHRLAKLQGDDEKALFNSVIVITDRRVLDKQLQDAIYQLEHRAGVVEKIDKDSNQLARALQNGTRIIITTLQKFPFVMEKVSDLGDGKYAVIIDEAHSSQTGKSATALKNILSNQTLEQAMEADKVTEDNIDEIEEKILETIIKSGKQDNLSFFAFTATPKAKTLEMFGERGKDGKPKAYHVYSMRQAIEEGFILDVLKNYMTYSTFYKVSKTVSEDPELGGKKATKAIARFVSLHPHNIAQKTEIIIEHFRQVTRHKIGGRAKAMVVTGSRLHAVRYKQAFDKYIKEKGYTDLKTLVAFSGTVDDNGTQYTEPYMNGIGEKELPEKFHTDEYKVLLVAEKYQTGFDEPLLHTMYVDKKLDGVKAVQTLSRLNRICKGKNDTFILDFVNDAEDIQKAFQPYYEVTGLESTTDPNILYDLQTELDMCQVYTHEEIDDVSKIEFKGSHRTHLGQEKLNSILDKAVQRFNHELNQETQDTFKGATSKFVRTYAFILQIAPFADIELHKLYVFLNYLLRKLPRNVSENVNIADDVALEYYRNQKTFDGSISLAKEGEVDLSPTSFGKSVSNEEEKVTLSSIIDKLNKKFSTDFTDADRLSYEQIKADSMKSTDMEQKAKNNTKDNFKLSVDDIVTNIAVNRMGKNHNFFLKVIEDPEFRKLLIDELVDDVYQELRG
ncbi:restriction endonuclease subunit R [Bacillus sp. MYb56]|uniref:type I restriction endonuclease subunit R n=1 Tax=Bacillus sp. MYb56 TaxID=1827287 RepID=UPI000CFB1B64|nr:type I restriction endonuclease [Bacillus sp. MYb56]PRD10420.1 restriction endonuclease subunit R [Bacillus sp. MYb56]